MSERWLPVQLPSALAGPLALRAGRCAYVDARDVVIVDVEGVRRLTADWIVDDCQLSADGRYAAALGDDGKHATVWDATSGQRLLDATGLAHRRQSLRIGLASVSGEPAVLTAPFNQPISVMSLRDRREIARLTTTGLVWFHPLAFTELDSEWFAVRGHLDGEQYDSIIVLSWAHALRDRDALPDAFTQPTAIKGWGYQIGIGPGSPGHAAIFRDPEWGDDEPPDDEDESFCGVAVWNLKTASIEQRIALSTGSIVAPTGMGGDATRVAITAGHDVAIVDRATGTITRREALALDPYRLDLARREPDGVRVTPL